MIRIDEVEIDLNDVIDFNPLQEMMTLDRVPGKYEALRNVISHHTNDFRLTIYVGDDLILSNIKHEFIHGVRNSKRPEDRVLEFEWYPDLNERDRLIEARRTKKEKEDYNNELIKNIEYCNKFNLDSRIFKKELKNKLAGSFKGTV